MSNQAIEAALKLDLPISTDKLVCLALAHHHNGDTGRCFPSVKTLMQKASKSRATLFRSLARLQKLRLIEVIPHFDKIGRQERSSYRLLFIDKAQKSARLTGETGEGLTSETPITGSIEQEGNTPSGTYLTPSGVRPADAPSARRSAPANRIPFEHRDLSAFPDWDRMCRAVFLEGESIEFPQLDADKLRAWLRDKTAGRIGRHLLTSEGLEGARELLTCIMAAHFLTENRFGFERAIEILGRSLWSRIGSKPGQWLNSWHLIGLRLAGDAYCGEPEELAA